MAKDSKGLGGMLKADSRAMVRNTRANVGLVVGVTGLLWVIEILDTVLGGALDGFGVIPRSVSWLWGIAFAPFLHGGFGHLIANTFPLLVLGTLTMARKRMDFWVVSIASAITAGLGAWLFGASGTVHIGASGVIFGYFGFLLGRGIYERRPGAIVLSLLVGWFFGSMLWGVLPIVAGVGISWQSHLFGFLGGALTARLMGKEIRKRGR